MASNMDNLEGGPSREGAHDTTREKLGRRTNQAQDAKDAKDAKDVQPMHEQPVEGARDRKDGDVEAARQDPRPESGKDYWRAGQEEDPGAGDEGIDDGIGQRADDVELKDPNIPVTAQAEGERIDDEDVPPEARRNDINDRTR